MIIIGLGANSDGAFGTPYQSIQQAIRELAASGIEIKRTSRLYHTRADSPHPQPDFVNAILTAHTPLPAASLLQIFKGIEARAGRRQAKNEPPWRPRPLDLDLVSYKGVVRNWRLCQQKEPICVVLPHPRAHERAFVLTPLSEVIPLWHHPIFGLTAAELLKRPSVRQTGRIIRVEDFPN